MGHERLLAIPVIWRFEGRPAWWLCSSSLLCLCVHALLRPCVSSVIRNVWCVRICNWNSLFLWKAVETNANFRIFIEEYFEASLLQSEHMKWVCNCRCKSMVKKTGFFKYIFLQLLLHLHCCWSSYFWHTWPVLSITSHSCYYPLMVIGCL
jgi:hypothetical protein